MKIVRIYYKPPPSINLPHTDGRLYLRKMQGSYLISLALCHNEEQVRLIKDATNLQALLEEHSIVRQLGRYRDSKSVWIITPYTFTINTEGRNLEKVYDYINSNIDREAEVDGYNLIMDIVRCYSHWNHGSVKYIADNIDNDVEDTEDGFATKFYLTANSNSYFNGEDMEGCSISIGLENDKHTCEDCDNYTEYGEVDVLYYIESRDGYVCETCREDYYICSACDSYVHGDDSHYDDNSDGSYCESCWDNREDDYGIHSYDYQPYLKFYNYIKGEIAKSSDYRKDKVPYYGTEIEVECMGGSRSSYAEKITSYGGEDEKFFYCKRDGSLSHGFEICTMPMTFNAIKNLNLWESILKYRGRDKLQSYNTSTCGMHIHINREAFSDHHLFKFISFIHEFKSLVYLISQRKRVGELNQYSKFNNSFKEKAKGVMVNSIKNKKNSYQANKDDKSYIPAGKHCTANYGEKYVPVNLQHHNTIEVRIFKGNLREESIRKNFEFVDSLYYFTKNNPIYRLKVKEYLDHCYREMKSYPNLNSFIDQNSTKVKEIVNFPLSVPEGLDY